MKLLNVNEMFNNTQKWTIPCYYYITSINKERLLWWLHEINNKSGKTTINVILLCVNYCGYNSTTATTQYLHWGENLI